MDGVFCQPQIIDRRATVPALASISTTNPARAEAARHPTPAARDPTLTL